MQWLNYLSSQSSLPGVYERTMSKRKRGLSLFRAGLARDLFWIEKEKMFLTRRGNDCLTQKEMGEKLERRQVCQFNIGNLILKKKKSSQPKRLGGGGVRGRDNSSHLLSEYSWLQKAKKVARNDQAQHRGRKEALTPPPQRSPPEWQWLWWPERP